MAAINIYIQSASGCKYLFQKSTPTTNAIILFVCLFRHRKRHGVKQREFMRAYNLPKAPKYNYTRKCGPGNFSGRELQCGFYRSNAL